MWLLLKRNLALLCRHHLVRWCSFMLQLSACGQAANTRSIFPISVLLFTIAVVAPGVLKEGEQEASVHSWTQDTLQRSLGDSTGEMPPGLPQEREAVCCSPEGLTTSLMTSKQTKERAVS